MTVLEVKAQAKAFVDTISAMHAKERQEHPSAVLVKRFNRVLELAKGAAPQLADWPDAIEIDEENYIVFSVRHGDLEVFARQIVDALAFAQPKPQGRVVTLARLRR